MFERLQVFIFTFLTRISLFYNRYHRFIPKSERSSEIEKDRGRKIDRQTEKREGKNGKRDNQSQRLKRVEREVSS